MGDPSVTRPGDGEIIGDSPDRRVEILCEHDALHATWSRFGPRRQGADPHVHRRHTDVFYVLDGELVVRLGPDREDVAVPAGTVALVPPMLVHGYGNDTDADVRYLNVHAPGEGFADYMRGLRDGRRHPFDQWPPPDDGGRPATDAILSAGRPLSDGPGLRVAVLADVEALGIAETRAEADHPEAPAHVHRRHVECFYVLEGELAITVGDREVRAPAGSWVTVPADVPHALSFPEPVRFLDLHAPSFGLGALDHEPAT